MNSPVKKTSQIPESDMMTRLICVFGLMLAIGFSSVSATAQEAAKAAPPATPAPATTPAPPATPGIRWVNAAEMPLEGRGWSDVADHYDRLPERAKDLVPPSVWGLSRNSTGMNVRFKTNARQIKAKWTLRSDRLAMPHMAATGVSGLDLFVKTEKGWRFLAVGQPTKKENEATLVSGLTDAEKEFRMYLPLYNGVTHVEIGVPEEASFEVLKDDAAPVVFYGTSITQGGCAARSGLAYPSIIGRQLEVPTINLGFSGSGKSEPALADLLSELKASVYVLDPLPNMTPEMTAERLPKFVEILRKSHPETPIVLVENVIYTDSPFLESRRQKTDANNAALKALYEERIKAGDKNLYYVPARDLLGDDAEGTVDSVHPTDLGFIRMAEVIGPVVKKALGR